MTQITNSQTLRIDQDGLHEVHIQGKDIALHLEVSAQASVFLVYEGMSSSVSVTMDLQTTQPVTMLHWNQTQDALALKVAHRLYRDAQLTLGFGELSNANADYQIQVDLMESGAEVVYNSASIASNKIHYNVKVIHHAPHTSAKMENYAIVKRGADLYIYDEGNIQKGAYGSSSHQTSRVLTLDRDQKSEVLPLLLIEENDVAASHATSVGQPDENQLYYLQTRGLNRMQALGLMSIGYIMPIAEIIANETLAETLKARISERVSQL
ncbi:MAG: SufB/SufD family protein [Erysipelotrichaceae bacterium]